MDSARMASPIARCQEGGSKRGESEGAQWQFVSPRLCRAYIPFVIGALVLMTRWTSCQNQTGFWQIRTNGQLLFIVRWAFSCMWHNDWGRELPWFVIRLEGGFSLALGREIKSSNINQTQLVAKLGSRRVNMFGLANISTRLFEVSDAAWGIQCEERIGLGSDWEGQPWKA